MSEESGKIISAYDKMLQSGEANKKIDMTRIQNQMYAQAGMADGGGVVPQPVQQQPLGNPVVGSNMEEDYTDFSAIDNSMQMRMNSLREKMNLKKTMVATESIEILKLKRRVKQLEEAMMLLMQTQENIIEGKYNK